ncbi:hypothetical protein MASR2M70_12840 [Bacillota bacterium]
MNLEKVVKSNQEQAVAAWIDYLNQLRLTALVKSLNEHRANLDVSMEMIDEALGEIGKIIENNRGNDKGMHGFLAEVAEYGIGNARELLEGRPNNYEWVNDNGPVDLIRNGIGIQQKFYESDGMFSLGAATEHLKKYPDFLKGGKKYQIPNDQFETVKRLYSMTEKEAYKALSSSGDGPSPRQWRKVHEFFETSDIKLEDLEPAQITYAEAQKDVVKQTMEVERSSLLERERELEEAAHDKSKPSFDEGAKVTIAAAAIEGGAALGVAIAKKIKSGKHIKDFDTNDWKDIFGDAGIATLKGGIRGAGIYALANYTATPAAVASALATASFGVAEQIHLYRSGKITGTEWIENSELLCLDATVSAVAALIGQVAIPIPILGAVIGNTVGNLIYQAGKDAFTEREKSTVAKYLADLSKLDEDLNEEYSKYVEGLSKEVELFMNLVMKAFSPDYMTAFSGSIELAVKMGVTTGEILDTIDKGRAFFME